MSESPQAGTGYAPRAKREYPMPEPPDGGEGHTDVPGGRPVHIPSIMPYALSLSAWVLLGWGLVA